MEIYFLRHKSNQQINLEMFEEFNEIFASNGIKILGFCIMTIVAYSMSINCLNSTSMQGTFPHTYTVLMLVVTLFVGLYAVPHAYRSARAIIGR